MTATAKILTSVHGKRLGLGLTGQLVVNGRTAVTADDNGVTKRVQAAPGTLDATGTLTAALIGKGIVTSAAAAVTATLDTGALMDAGFPEVAIGEGIEWSVIKIGANAFTLAGSDGHTVVGTLAVATATSAHYISKRTAASTWVTYRLG